jgi:hypothetical protein
VKNLYQPSKLLSKSEFAKITKALEKSWGEETATFADVKKKWSKDNPPRGQCLVTAVIINDLFGGKLVYDRIHHHLWNELPDGTWQDFTRKQFKTKTALVITKYKTKNEVLSDEHAIKNKTANRYKLLKQKFEEIYGKIN